MTEEQAKTRWCPFVGRMMNRREEFRLGENDNPNCIGSACMAWRWDRVEHSDEGQLVSTWPDLVPFHAPGTMLIRHGFCGLAGKV